MWLPFNKYKHNYVLAQFEKNCANTLLGAIINRKQKNMEHTTTQELDKLFTFASPQTLKDRIHYLFFQYTSNTEVSDLPPDFKDLSQDIYFLMDFLDKQIIQTKIKDNLQIN